MIPRKKERLFPSYSILTHNEIFEEKITYFDAYFKFIG